MRIKNYKCLLLVVALFLVGCKEPILHNLSEPESNRLITRLHEAGILAEKRVQPDGSWALSVDSSETLQALSALSDARVFRRHVSEQKQFSDSMIPSREAQRFQFERAISEELEVTLSALSGVLEARVHLYLPPTDPLFGKDLTKDFNATASVLLITDGRFRESKESIQELVSGASGVNAGKVSVLVSAPKEQKEGFAKKQLVEAKQDESSNDLAEFTVREPIEVEENPLRPIESLRDQPISSPQMFQGWWIVVSLLLLAVGIALLKFQKRLSFRGRRRPTAAKAFEQHLEGLSLHDRERAA